MPVSVRCGFPADTLKIRYVQQADTVNSPVPFVDIYVVPLRVVSHYTPTVTSPCLQAPWHRRCTAFPSFGLSQAVSLDHYGFTKYSLYPFAAPGDAFDSHSGYFRSHFPK